jgi:hypothetical protein
VIHDADPCSVGVLHDVQIVVVHANEELDRASGLVGGPPAGAVAGVTPVRAVRRPALYVPSEVHLVECLGFMSRMRWCRAVSWSAVTGGCARSGP